MTLATGVLMSIGNYDLADYPDRTQREVHASRRSESITYRIEESSPFVGFETSDGDKWEHYNYKFTYRHLGRTMTVSWKCGTLYGDPKPWDGLQAMINDAECVAYEGFGEDWVGNYGFEDYDRAERVYKACERAGTRLNNFFDMDYKQTDWVKILETDKFA